MSICRKPFFDLSLYLVANRSSFPDETAFFTKVAEAVKGGVTCVQLRDLQSDQFSILKTAAQLRTILKGVPLFINTLHIFDVAKAVNADGVYLEEPFSYLEARRILGPRAIIGIPVKNLEDIAKVGPEIDYLSVKVAPSKWTCPTNNLIWGIDGLHEILTMTPHRVVAIGGLNLHLAASIYRELRPGDGIAMAGGIMNEKDPFSTAQKIRAILQEKRHD
jgi:thiamine-phosphate pyrophosphorylase